MTGPRMAFFGSSLVSAYWNGAATYYRGLLRALADLGVRITFYEPDAYDRQAHRDMPDPEWARVVVYPGTVDGADWALEQTTDADILVKASGVGVCDTWLEAAVAAGTRARQTRIYWDVDAPATLDRMRQDPADPLRACVADFDVVLTYGGGPPVVDGFVRLGARAVVPIYNALDPLTHHSVPPDPRFAADLAFLGNRLPDREARVAEFFLRPAERLAARRFLLGGSGWQPRDLPGNVRYVGHVGTTDHNALNSTAGLVLNVNRSSMAATGFSPPTRVFEAAGAGACIVTDAWTGIEDFLEPGREILIAADGEDVAALVSQVGRVERQAIGRAAQRRVLAEHTYTLRAAEVARVLGLSVARSV